MGWRSHEVRAVHTSGFMRVTAHSTLTLTISYAKRRRSFLVNPKGRFSNFSTWFTKSFSTSSGRSAVPNNCSCPTAFMFIPSIRLFRVSFSTQWSSCRAIKSHMAHPICGQYSLHHFFFPLSVFASIRHPN